MVGDCCWRGEGTPRNPVAAAGWYRRAAGQNAASARAKLDAPAFQFALGSCYHEGEQTEKNEEMAARCYQRAAEQGHRGAMEALSRCYRLGLGVRRDLTQAAKWQLRAKKGL